MPPKKARGPRPSADDIGRIRAWIDQGARWPEGAKVDDAGNAKSHWSFKKPVRPALLEVRDPSWPRNPIDRFVLARLEKEGLKPSPEADKVTLIRRLSLDLIGLPPTIAEVDAFVADTRPDAYERLVDRLLASPHYGERWARRWLDKARYADTNGYEKDRERSIWPYRDWVVKSLNDDMPFDRFTIAQIAGDMLPNATPADRIASGFHRNTMRNEEGGIDVEEFRYAALVDRVATTGATWLGLTIQCAQCHTHKYDPITQREYYQFLAYFNNTDEPEEYDVPDGPIAARRAEIAREVDRLTADLENQFPATDPESGWSVMKPIEAKSEGGATLAIHADGVISASGTAPDKDVYTITFDLPDSAASLRLDALGRRKFGRRRAGSNPSRQLRADGYRDGDRPGGEGRPAGSCHHPRGHRRLHAERVRPDGYARRRPAHRLGDSGRIGTARQEPRGDVRHQGLAAEAKGRRGSSSRSSKNMAARTLSAGSGSA